MFLTLPSLPSTPSSSTPGAEPPAAASDPSDPQELGGFDDGLGALYSAICDLQQLGVSSGNALVLQNEGLERQEQAAQQAALQRAQSDQSSSGGGLLGCIGKAVGDFVDDVAHLRIGKAFSDAGNDLGQAWNSPHFWSDLGKVLTDVSMVSGVAAEVAPLLGPLAAPVEAVAQGTTAVATAGQGLVHFRTGEFAADAQDAQASATQAQDQLSLLATRERQSLSDLSDQSQAQQGSLAALVQAIETNDGTGLGAATFRIRG
jgi:hypothetical protein